MKNKMNKDGDKLSELILLYEHFLGEMKDIVDDKFVILEEVEELSKSIALIEVRLEELYSEINDGKTT